MSMFVCVCVCVVCLSTSVFGTTVQSSQNLCMLPMAVARSSSGGIAIRYVQSTHAKNMHTKLMAIFCRILTDFLNSLTARFSNRPPKLQYSG